jgi:polar amino acid transport system substrate-binding protein
MRSRRWSSALAATLLVMAACQGGGQTAATAEATPEAAESPAAGGDGEEMLTRIQEEGVIRVATDPAYPPQSELLPDGTFEGFDIDVANEIGERLGVEVEFETPNFDEVVAGNWADRWDISVGSVTITTEREAVLDFTEPYYFTPAQMAATEESGITDLEGLAGMTVCVGEATTYQSWLEGTLEIAGEAPEPAEPPEDVEVTTFSTDTECADAVQGGRFEFEGWLTSSTTLANAINEGAPFVEVGDPVFFEPLAVATDKAGPPHDELQAELDRIIGEMHEDGTLSELSEKWFEGLDLTTSEQ